MNEWNTADENHDTTNGKSYFLYSSLFFYFKLNLFQYQFGTLFLLLEHATVPDILHKSKNLMRYYYYFY